MVELGFDNITNPWLAIYSKITTKGVCTEHFDMGTRKGIVSFILLEQFINHKIKVTQKTPALLSHEPQVHE